MKTKLAALLLALTTALSSGHGGVELGPNKGRLLEFSSNDSMHGEVTITDGKFHIALLDKDMKPVALAEQTLTATGGTRTKPVKLEVTRVTGGFTLPLVKEGEWLILQYKETAKSKAITARLHYDTGNCDGCKKPEWLCECKPEEPKTKKPDAGKKKS